MMDAVCDVLIIGGGPAGLTAAQYTARARQRTLVLDRSPDAGALARQGRIENYPGLLEPSSGRDLLARLRAQATAFGAEYRQTAVDAVDFSGDGRAVYTAEGVYSGTCAIIATGSLGWKPTLPGAAELLGRGVSYCATCDAALQAGKTIAVLGDTEEAFEEALEVAGFAETVYLLTPTDKVWASDDLLEHARSHPKVQVRLGVRALAVLGTEEVGGLWVQGPAGEEDLRVQGIFIYLQGGEPITDFLGGSVAIDETRCLAVSPLMHTSVEGVFAAGDVVCNRLRQVVIACGQGATAAIEANRYLAERKRRE